MRTIRVTGEGQIRLRPDRTRVELTVEGLEPDYAAALEASADKTNALRDAAALLGFDRSELKTLSFGVDAEYEGYSEDGVYKQRFAGYRYRHGLRLEFGSDNELLGRLLYALGASPAKPELHLSYTVSDRESAKAELLRCAVRDAAEKAAALASAAGVALGAIQSVDCAAAEPELVARPVSRLMAADGFAPAAKMSCAVDIEPEDVTASGTVTVIWEIE